MATAGTTDFGSVDPLEATADLAAKHGVWLHVDAAYGFGALFSSRLAPRLRGIERASSITLDMHKLGFQPAAASQTDVVGTLSVIFADEVVMTHAGGRLGSRGPLQGGETHA